jgi:hypothetical protein
MPWRDVAGVPSLLQELLDHAEGHPKPVGNLGPRTLFPVVGGQYSLAQIQGEGSHLQTLPEPTSCGYTIY